MPTENRKRKLEDNNETSSKIIAVSKVKHSGDEKAISGYVLACGQGIVGQLGLGEDVMEKKRFQMVTKQPVGIKIAAGGMHSLYLDSSGTVYSFGCNDECALGRVTAEEEECFVPKKVEIPTKIVQISAGDSHSAALDEVGDVYIWGTFRDNNGVLGLNPGQLRPLITPTLLEGVPKIQKISSGYNHLALLSTDQRLFTCGCAEQGELGRVPRTSVVKGGRRGIGKILLPAEVRFSRRNIKVVDVWSFSYNTFCRTADNKIYAWGLNNYHQLGINEEYVNNYFMPKHVSALTKLGTISDIKGGEHHTVIKTESGLVFVLGRGDCGRLGNGHEDTYSQSVPYQLPLQDVSIIGCGSCVSFAVNSEGKLYSWGFGTNNQLGNGDDEDLLEPTLITSKQLEARKVIEVSAGGQHSLSLVKDS